MPFSKLQKDNWNPDQTKEENIAAGNRTWSKTDTDKLDANMDYAQGELDKLDTRVAAVEGASGGVTEEQMNTAIDTALEPYETATVAGGKYATKTELAGKADTDDIPDVSGFQTAEQVQAIVDEDIAALQGQVTLKTEFEPVKTTVNDATIGNSALNTGKLGSAEAATTYATKTELAGKQDAGDYATNAALTALEERVAALESAGG